jgi:glycosyltransferase involved in cell wall biosynthesis
MSDGLNVWMVSSTSFPPEEGIGYYVYNLSQKLLDRGHSVTVVTRGSLRTERTSYDGIEVVKAPYAPLYPFHVDVHGLFVNRLVEQHLDEIDLLHVHTPLAPVVDVDVPTVATIHTSIIEDGKHLDQGGLDALQFKLVERLASRRLIGGQRDAADHVTTVAESVAEELDRYYDIPGASVFANGVDPTEFDPVDPAIDDGYLLYVGRLGQRKGVGDLLEAVAQLDGVDLRLVGQGPFAQRYRERAEQMGIDDRVEFLGFVDREELIDLYRGATAFVLPSHYEGLPTVLLEAMVCARPVVATAVSGCLDVIEDGENGVLVPPKSPDDIAEAVSELLADPDRRHELGRAARETVLDRYTWETVGSDYEALYRELSGLLAETGSEGTSQKPSTARSVQHK